MCTIVYIWPKFWFQNKKGSSKNSCKRPVYESVDIRSLSLFLPKKIINHDWTVVVNKCCLFLTMLNVGLAFKIFVRKVNLWEINSIVSYFHQQWMLVLISRLDIWTSKLIPTDRKSSKVSQSFSLITPPPLLSPHPPLLVRAIHLSCTSAHRTTLSELLRQPPRLPNVLPPPCLLS